ncbi:MAG: SDR family oxidoreductase [Chloroflexi bacterium]|nr:SDR family oxidoreductase [Chloroflexota bacterium]
MDSAYLETLFGLSGKTAVVTGGGGILCGAMSKALARAGARIAVLDLFPEAAQKVVDEISASDGQALAVQCDVLDRASVEAAARKVLAEFGRADFLINGAGGNKKEATTTTDLSFFDLPAEAIQWVFNLNCVGTILPSQVFGRAMVERGAGSILNIASVNAYLPLTRIPAYSAAKAAVANFTQWLAVHMAQEYSPHIRVNAIAPGFFLTTQNRFLLTDEQTGDLTARGQTIVDHTPMGRFGDPEELLGTVIWLLSPASAFVTGAVVPVDGGFCAFSGV